MKLEDGKGMVYKKETLKKLWVLRIFDLCMFVYVVKRTKMEVEMKGG